MYSVIAFASPFILLINDSSLSVLRVAGMVVGSCVLGFLIGSMFALMAVSVVRSNRGTGEFPVRKAMLIGGISGAIIASISLLILIYS